MSTSNILKQPKPFYVIFSIEMWERFGYYGMQAIMVLYMVKRLGMSDALAFNTFSAFAAMVYALISIGGFIGDRVLGTKRTILFGAIVLAFGYYLLGLDRLNTVFLGLGFIVVGNGLFKANPSSLLSKCYAADDYRLDGAFTLYYMAVNIGSFIGLALVPSVASHYGYRWGFWISSIGLLIAVANYFIFYRWISHVASVAGKLPLHWGKFLIVLIGTIAGAFLAMWILQHLVVAHYLLLIIGIVVAVYFIYEIIKSSRSERSKLIIALVLMLEAVIFFVLYQQMPTSLNFFAINNMHHDIFGMSVNPLVFQSLNPFWILVASPLLAYFYNRLGLRGKDLSMASKFTTGMFLCSISFLVLYLSQYFSDASGLVSSDWIILSYLFQSVGELMVSGLGLAMVARFVPQRLMGVLMGAWFMACAAGMMLGGFVASLTSVPQNLPAVQSLTVYTHTFLEIGVVTLIISIVMLAFTPKLNRYINT